MNIREIINIEKLAQARSRNILAFYNLLKRNNVTFGELLASVQLTYGLDQRELKKILECSQGRVSQLLHDYHPLKEYTYLKYLTLLDGKLILDFEVEFNYIIENRG